MLKSVELLLDDPPCLVVNKPGGLLTQSPPGIDSLEDRVRAFEQRRRGGEGNIYLGVPHRLDRPASGAIVFARNIRATRRLSEQFAGRLVDKRYWVLVEGTLAEPSGTWHDTLRKVPGEPRVEVVPPSHPEGRLAVLHYRVLGVGEYGSWLEIRLETGRTHQIRVQCASRGLAVRGDAQYGATCENSARRWTIGASGGLPCTRGGWSLLIRNRASGLSSRPRCRRPGRPLRPRAAGSRRRRPAEWVSAAWAEAE